MPSSGRYLEQNPPAIKPGLPWVAPFPVGGNVQNVEILFGLEVDSVIRDTGPGMVRCTVVLYIVG